VICGNSVRIEYTRGQLAVMTCHWSPSSSLVHCPRPHLIVLPCPRSHPHGRPPHPRSPASLRHPRRRSVVLVLTVIVMALALSVVLVPSRSTSPPPFSLSLPSASTLSLSPSSPLPLFSPSPSPSFLALYLPYDGTGGPRQDGVACRPHAGSDCPLLASSEGLLTLTRLCVHLMPAFPRRPNESPNSSC